MKGLGLEIPSYIRELYLSITTPFPDEKPKKIKDEDLDNCDNVNQSNDIDDESQSKFSINDKSRSKFSIDEKNQSHYDDKTDMNQLETRNLKRECDVEEDDDIEKVQNKVFKSCETKEK